MATWTFSWPGTDILCDSKVPGVDNILKLTLDTEKFPGFSNPLEATITVAIGGKVVWDDDQSKFVQGWEFTVTADDDDMPEIMGLPATSVDACDILDVECKGCCEIINERLDTLGFGSGWAVLEETIDAGMNYVDVALTVALIEEGFTTEHIYSFLLLRLESTSEMAVSDVSNDSGSSVRFNFTGIETEDNGHKLRVFLKKA